MAERALALACDPPAGVDPCTALIEGAVFARMAASRGAVSDHELCIAIAGEMFRLDDGMVSDDLLAEALARCELMADAGSEEAAQFLATRLQDTSPAVVVLAQQFRARLTNVEETK
ncbi:hypothetical protein [Alteraurantiacibacter buctensis]|uniref:Uncharacterized protein n=1 Tax=Alteraurantiacibacter buctensis TaxID=1503981 RepID=A0A844Z1N9_9SPHN|nr:hypothetical protein [Alteraurantiacibacter buctensis]MXO72367.1 hypothetical protein [Alteraurantiacibacter buctensis]